jgi:hypothetical protein
MLDPHFARQPFFSNCRNTVVDVDVFIGDGPAIARGVGAGVIHCG